MHFSSGNGRVLGGGRLIEEVIPDGTTPESAAKEFATGEAAWFSPLKAPGDDWSAAGDG